MKTYSLESAFVRAYTTAAVAVQGVLDKVATFEEITRPPRQPWGDIDGVHTYACYACGETGDDAHECPPFAGLCGLEGGPCGCDRTSQGCAAFHARGAEQLAEREAEEEVSEPVTRADYLGPYHAQHVDDGPPYLISHVHDWFHVVAGDDERGLWQPPGDRPLPLVFETGQDMDDVPNPCEPGLTDDELVGVRELLERFGLADVPAPSAAGTSPPEVSGLPAPPSGGHSRYDQIGGSGPW